MVLHTPFNNRQICFEVQFKHAQRRLNVSGRSGDGYQRQDYITFSDVVFDPFFVDGDITFKEMETRVVFPFLDAIGIHVHAVYFPVGGVDNALGQVMADKAIYTKDQYFFHDVSYRFPFFGLIVKFK